MLSLPIEQADRRKAAAVFALFAIIFGVSSVFLTPPLQVPDEHTHFYRAFDVSRGHLIARTPVVLPKSLLALQAQYPPRLETAWAEYRTLTFNELFHSLREDLRPDDTLDVPSGHIYTFVPYLPSAFGMLIARRLGASALGLLYTGRLFNLLVYTCLICWALLKLPGLHLPFLMVVAMPMSMQQAASLSGDSVTIAVTVLYIAVILALCFEDEGKLLGWRDYGVVLLLAATVVMAKANIAIVLLPVIIPAARFGGTKRKTLLITAYVLAAYLPFAAWQYLDRENLEIFRNASLQAGVDIPANIAFVKSHPADFLRVLGRTLQRNWKEYLTSLVGVAGWNAARLPFWTVSLYLLAIAVASASARRDRWLTSKQRLVLAAILVASLLSVFIALWSLETQHRNTGKALVESSTTIANVQGRYFITILALAVVVISSRTRSKTGDRVSAILAPVMVMMAGVTFWVVIWHAYYKAPSGESSKQNEFLANVSNAGILCGGFFLLQVEDTYREGCQSFHFANRSLDTVPLIGDWNADGRTKVGMYHKGVFYLDYNGNGRFDGSEGGDRVYPFADGQPGDVPVIGDWNGDGRTKVGIFRSGFLWILDYNGNGKLDPVSTDGDRVFGLGGIPMDLPVVGDWNGDGRTKAGIYRHGAWLLQSEDTLSSNVRYITQRFGDDLIVEGRDCDVPVVGDWNGDRKTKIGMLLVRNRGVNARTYQWVLDRNGNGMFDGPGINNDAVFDLGGNPGDVPLIWNGARGRTSTVGVYRRGTWMVQQAFPGPGNLKSLHFAGLPQEIALAGDWSGDGTGTAGVLRGGTYWVLDIGGSGHESTFTFSKF